MELQTIYVITESLFAGLTKSKIFQSLRRSFCSWSRPVSSRYSVCGKSLLARIRPESLHCYRFINTVRYQLPIRAMLLAVCSIHLKFFRLYYYSHLKSAPSLFSRWGKHHDSYHKVDWSEYGRFLLPQKDVQSYLLTVHAIDIGNILLSTPKWFFRSSYEQLFYWKIVLFSRSCADVRHLFSAFCFG